MKKVSKSSKKGFTLVELIVVLVILAILAAMLVPALTGYIKRAREEKDYQAAATVLTAAQSLVAEYYGKTPTDNLKISSAKTYAANVTEINRLTGLELTSGAVTIDSINSNYGITGITVVINSNTYTWANNTWNSDIANR